MTAYRPISADGATFGPGPSPAILEFAVAFLAPMFLGAGASDPHAARLAALETVAAYGARTRAELMAVAQTVAFGLAVMDNLMVSFASDVSLAMKLRLRSGANGLNRSARQTQQGLDKRRDDPPPRAGLAVPAAVAVEPGPVDDDDAGQGEVDAAVERARTLVAEAHARMHAAQGPARQAVAPPDSSADAARPPVAQAAAWPAEAVEAGTVGAAGGAGRQVAAEPASAGPAPGQPAHPQRAAERPVAAQPPEPAARPAEACAGTGGSAGPVVDDQGNKLMWASAMAKVAGDVSRREGVPPALRASNKMWANALAHQANCLAAGSDGAPEPAEPAALATAGKLERR